MDLYLLRHGIGGSADGSHFPNDSLRPLTERGHDRMHELSKAVGRLRLRINCIWTSPYLRAVQTAEMFSQQVLNERKVQEHKELSPEGNVRRLMGDIADLDSSIDGLLLVGHEPGLSALLSILTNGNVDLRVELKKGGLAKLILDNRIGLERCGTLQWLLPPRVLLALTAKEDLQRVGRDLSHSRSAPRF